MRLQTLTDAYPAMSSQSLIATGCGMLCVRSLPPSRAAIDSSILT